MDQRSIYHQRWYAEEYDQDRFSGAFGRYLHDHEVGTFLTMIDGSHGRVLDVGTGSGKLSLPVLLQSRRVISIDSSSEMLRIARSKAEKHSMTLRSAICDIHDLCFPDDTFECVISSRVLMHLGDWKKGLSELCRVAQVVVVDFPPLQAFSGLDSLFKGFISRFSTGTQKYRTFSIRSIKREMQRHGFQIVELKRHFFLPIAFHRHLNRPRISLRIEKFFRKLGLVSLMGAPVTVKAIKIGYQDLGDK
jgi:ubiquinone/menaquinone biosynthesis C-methylase UbiE